MAQTSGALARPCSPHQRPLVRLTNEYDDANSFSAETNLPSNHTFQGERDVTPPMGAAGLDIRWAHLCCSSLNLGLLRALLLLAASPLPPLPLSPPSSPATFERPKPLPRRLNDPPTRVCENVLPLENQPFRPSAILIILRQNSVHQRFGNHACDHAESACCEGGIGDGGGT